MTPSEAFNDVGDATSGSITDRAGLTVTIDDAASPDGVRVQVGTGSGHITLDACGFTETVDAASELIITCGSVKLHVIQGAAQVVLDGGTVVSIPAGVTASVTDNGNGSFQVQNLGGGNVTITANGVPTTIGPGQSQTVSGQSLTALSSAHGWIGLKSSDDQGTPFDLRVELLKNGVPVANGLTRCITGVTRNAAQAIEALVPWDAFAPVSTSTGDTLALRFSTRIGTNPNDSKCTGPGRSHSSAVGLRFYYDAASRPSSFGATIAPNPSQSFYLHSNGNACTSAESSGVTNRFLNTTVPSAANAKCKDSPAVKFTGGNAWKDIGTWSLAPLP